MTDLFKNSNQTVRMLDFVNILYKKYKVLNKLSEGQSREFQSQVVKLLVDGDQNVDRETYEDIVRNIGFQNFVLEVLGNVVNRTPFKNQYELNRNLDAITQKIKKNQEELQKKQKVLERKEEKIKAAEQHIFTTCKQKITLLQNESLKKLTVKQTQMRKSLNVLLNQLKAKEKIILEKYEVIKTSKCTLINLEQKQKAVAEKMRYLDKRQKEMKNKDLQQSLLKKGNQNQQFEDKIRKLKEQLKDINSKHKNMEMAYRKIKNQNEKLMNQRNEMKQKIIQSEQKKKPKEKIKNELDNLELSIIHNKVEEEQRINREDLEQKLIEIVELVTNEKEKMKVVQIISTILGKQLGCSQFAPSSQIIESHLQFLKEQSPSFDSSETILKQIQAINVQDPPSKQKLIENGTIELILQKIAKLRFPIEPSSELLEVILPMMEMDQAHQASSRYLSQQNIVEYLQRIYLCHETNTDIAESSTLILSRLKLWKGELKLNEQFKKSIEIRFRVQSSHSILWLNIKYLLDS